MESILKNKQNKKIVDAIHIGLPKCASNVLQRYMLKDHPGILCITPKFTNTMKNDINSLMAFNFDFNPDNFKKQLKSEKKKNKKLVLSHEGFAGGMKDASNARIIADELYRLFGKTKVIIVIRERYSYIYSVYKHTVKRGATYSLKRFIRKYGDEKKHNLIENPGANLFERVAHYKLIEYYQQLYGKDNVKVMLYEDLKRSFGDFAAEIHEFLEVDKITMRNMYFNKSPSFPGLLSWLNFFTKTSFNDGKLRILPWRMNSMAKSLLKNVNSRPNYKKKIRKYLTNKEITYIKECNRRLNKLIPKNLKEYGYDM